MSLTGHSAIVRTVCFSPVDDLVLLSGGLSNFHWLITLLLDDTDLKVWNSETGRNIANLKGHSGSIYSVKMSNDGSYAMSVGTDKFIRIWDIRAKSAVCAIDGTKYSDMNEICFSSSPSIEAVHSS
jgi:WD40 repeat protein